MKQMTSVVSLIVLLATFADPSAAGTLAPKKPSELMVVASLLSPCGPPGSAPSFILDTVINPDGSFSPLVIPPGYVLILTHWSFKGEYASPDPRTIVLDIGGFPVAATVVVPVGAIDLGTITASLGSFAATLPSIAVAPGTTICLSPGNAFGVLPRVYGFLAKDR